MTYEKNAMENALGNNRICLRHQKIQGVKFAFFFGKKDAIRPRKKHWKVKCPLDTRILKVLLPAFGTAGTHPQVHWVDDVGCAHCNADVSRSLRFYHDYNNAFPNRMQSEEVVIRFSCAKCFDKGLLTLDFVRSQQGKGVASLCMLKSQVYSTANNCGLQMSYIWRPTRLRHVPM